MTMMRGLMTAALLVATGAPLAAQARPGTHLSRQVEAALQRQQQLGLDAAQVTALESIRSELDRRVEEARTAREARRAEREERPESQEERREWRRAQMDALRADRARADTVRAELQARFEQALPPLQRQELMRAQRGDHRDRMMRPGMRGARMDAIRGAREGALRVPRALRRLEREGRDNGMRIPPRLERWRR